MSNLRYLWLPTQSPYVNLSVEEYLLMQSQTDVFMLWQDMDSVIVGRHQNTAAEINQEYIDAHHIPVVRRLTGGGAVFHDLGNLNFTFIKNIQPHEKEINFIKYLQPIVDALQSLGVPAQFAGRNDLVIEDKKISGNAMVFYRNRVLEHGTLLFSTTKQNLAPALKADPDKFKDKAVKSVRNRVTNISEYLPKQMSVLEFKDYLMNFIVSQNADAHIDNLTEEERVEIEHLSKDKYATWEWNYGSSPKYEIVNKIRTKGGSVQVMMNIVNGHIAAIRFYGDFFSQIEPEKLEHQLCGIPYMAKAVAQKLAEFDLSAFFGSVSQEEILSLLMRN